MKLYILIFSLLIANNSLIEHSKMNLDEALNGTKAPKEIIDSLIIVDVEYYNFDKKLCKGQLVINYTLKEDILEAFELIKKLKFPIAKVIPIVKYNWDDNKSMSDNNTSAFNYRFVANTNRLSNHSWGRAIDINPFQNPAIYNDGKISPRGAMYDTNAAGTLTANSDIVKFFKSRGWRWGGDWTSLKDYQHFDKQ